MDCKSEKKILSSVPTHKNFLLAIMSLNLISSSGQDLKSHTGPSFVKPVNDCQS